VQTAIQRFIKQTRLTQRVKCSPALVSTTEELKKRKKMLNSKRTKQRIALERAWAQQIDHINFNVANKPLLVEQVSKAFMRNLAQIRELQKYVKILQESGIDPDSHLTEEQKELLLSAEYYDRLNISAAFFPKNPENAAFLQNPQLMQALEQQQNQQLMMLQEYQ